MLTLAKRKQMLFYITTDELDLQDLALSIQCIGCAKLITLMHNNSTCSKLYPSVGKNSEIKSVTLAQAEPVSTQPWNTSLN